MAYVDGFVLPVPTKNIAAYKRIAQKAGKIWREHGALEYRECVGDDLDTKFGVPFARTVKAKRGETVLFAWIVYKSRAHRDRVNSHERSTADAGAESHAVRRRANGLWWLQNSG